MRFTMRSTSAVLAASLVGASACSPADERSSGSEIESRSHTQTASLADAVERPNFRDALAALADRQGVEIQWQGGPYEYSYDWGGGHARDAAEWEIDAFTPILDDELSLYPQGFLAKIGFTRVLLARDLWLTQSGVEQNISGYMFGDALLLSVSYTYKVNNRDKQRRYLHHLIWHQIDGLQGRMWEDPAWTALNPDGFEYGVLTAGGINDRSSDTGLLSTAYPGFINRYGTGNVPDDKADLFAYLMVVHGWVIEQTRRDPHLRAKVAAIKARMAELDPYFDEAFWTGIDAIGRNITPYVTP